MRSKINALFIAAIIQSFMASIPKKHSPHDLLQFILFEYNSRFIHNSPCFSSLHECYVKKRPLAVRPKVWFLQRQNNRFCIVTSSVSMQTSLSSICEKPHPQNSFQFCILGMYQIRVLYTVFLVFQGFSGAMRVKKRPLAVRPKVWFLFL